jgi:uncharacterized protein (DUF433 family)
MQIVNHIEIRDGQAFIVGHNLKAKQVARMHLWENQPIEAVMEHYDLTAAEVHAALTFYYDNRAALDAEYEQNMELLKRVGTSTAEFRAKIEARNRDKET